MIDAWLAADPRLKASVIHKRLVAEHGFTGHYQRVKLYVADARQRLARDTDGDDRLSGLHRRFEVVVGAQAQVDWGDEGAILLEAGIVKVYSFHTTLSYSRDPFCCFTTSQDLGTFIDCHRRAFAHFGGVPGSIVDDRTKTVVKRHVAPREAVPLHPKAAAFAAHYGFIIDVLAAYRPTGKGRVERQVAIVRDHVLAGRSFDSLAELDAGFAEWVPIRPGRCTAPTVSSSGCAPRWIMRRCVPDDDPRMINPRRYRMASARPRRRTRRRRNWPSSSVNRRARTGVDMTHLDPPPTRSRVHRPSPRITHR